MRKKLIVGNWKMNGSLATNALLLRDLCVFERHDRAEVVVCVPFPYLAQVRSELEYTEMSWGAQDVSSRDHGAYTGDVSASMLVDFGCRYVIVGHSERRMLHAETDDEVALKFSAAISSDICPILCLGETLEQRDSGVTNEVIIRQLDAVISTNGICALSSAVLAYEPVWAIGTGRTALPQQAQEVHALIRARIADSDQVIANNVRIVYGGSMKPENAPALLQQPDIDGGLIGGASLVVTEFMSIASFC